MKMKRRYSSLLYFNEKITVQNVVIETQREHAITITFCIQTCFRTKYYPPSPKKKLLYLSTDNFDMCNALNNSLPCIRLWN